MRMHTDQSPNPFSIFLFLSSFFRGQMNGFLVTNNFRAPYRTTTTAAQSYRLNTDSLIRRKTTKRVQGSNERSKKMFCFSFPAYWGLRVCWAGRAGVVRCPPRPGGTAWRAAGPAGPAGVLQGPHALKGLLQVLRCKLCLSPSTDYEPTIMYHGRPTIKSS